MSPYGRAPYTEEASVKTTAYLLEDIQRAWHRDAGAYMLPMKALQLELSRLYRDPDIRRHVLRAAHQQAGKPLPPELVDPDD